MKKKLLITWCFAICLFSLQAQTLTVISPEGLQPPYEVSPGTNVTFQWNYDGIEPTAFYSHDEEPVFPEFGPDPEWLQFNNFTDNGDGTYNFNMTVNEELYVLGGYYSSFGILMWSFSNIIQINIASGVSVINEDNWLCPTDGSFELLSVENTFETYQWFYNNQSIDGATSSTYEATEAGSYYVQVTSEGETMNSNTVHLETISVEMEADFDQDANTLLLSATEGMDDYQWLSGSTPNNLSAISGEETATYSAPITSTQVYYAVEATIGGCTVTSSASPVVQDDFEIPVIIINADTNSFNVVCEGTPITLSVSDVYTNYQWFHNGFEAGEGNIYDIYATWQEGSYSLTVMPEAWPEVEITSDVVEISYFSLISPSLVGVQNYSYHCAGEELSVTLGDEGYDYDWYVHEDYNYTEEDIVDVSGSTYTFTFEDATYLTVVATYQGCTASSNLFINSVANQELYLDISNYDQTFLCPDSAVVLSVPLGQTANFSGFQWYQVLNAETILIEGANSSFYSVEEPGDYYVEAISSVCEDLSINSNPVTINSHEDRLLEIFSDEMKICMGEETTLYIVSGDSWTNIQWFEEDIVMGTEYYEKIFIPIADGSTTSSQVVSEFNSYVVKARHQSCPNVLKSTSNTVQIAPLVNPVVTPDPNNGVTQWHIASYDSIAFYIFCIYEPVSLTVDDSYDSYSWYSQLYLGDDDYELGNLIVGEDSAMVNVVADVNWITAMVDSSGCIGVSDPIMLDAWFFQLPGIASFNNSELCEPGDSTLLHLAYNGDWVSYEWFVNGQPVPNSNNDSIYATVPGEYTLTAYPTLCPDMPHPSGVGPVVSFLNAYILENETMIYAMPELGIYEYQWYLNGEPIETTSDVPWVLLKEDMEDGIYTVEVTNPEPCSSLSDGFVWNTSGLNDRNSVDIKVFPNPAKDEVFINNLVINEVNTISLYDLKGKQLPVNLNSDRQSISIAEFPAGIYMLQIVLNDGRIANKRLVKQ